MQGYIWSLNQCKLSYLISSSLFIVALIFELFEETIFMFQPKNKKKFIDKKKAITFHVVHRSQQDPLIADENAPKHVLIPQVRANSFTVLSSHHGY